MDIEQELEQTPKGVIAWMAKNSVASNMLMFFLLIGGFLIARTTKQDVWPAQTPDNVHIGVSYPGSGPEEVEEGILLAIEDSIRGISGIREVTTRASEGYGEANVKLAGGDPNVALQNIKDAVDRITTFPSQAEKPVVSLDYSLGPEISLLLHGKQNYRAIRALAERIQDELATRTGIGSVQLRNAPPYEISIEIPLAKLRALHLTLDQVAAVIRDSTVNIPGGEVISRSGRILLRTQERRKFGKDFENISISASSTGSIVTLGEIATIRDDFEETESEITVDGGAAIQIEVYRNEKAKPIAFSKSVQEYLTEFRHTLPANIYVKVTADQTQYFHDRIELLRNDASMGLLLAFILLGLFLEIRVAFWITVCIPVSMCGAFLLLPLAHASINLISLFAFLVALGTTIDYSIIVGEHIYKKREEGNSLIVAAVEGTRDMIIPILFAVLINAVAFVPMLFAPGTLGNYFAQIPIISASVFAIALIEVLFILPSHLALRPQPHRLLDLLNRPKLTVNRYMMEFLAKRQIPAVNAAIRYRYHVVGIALVVFLACIGVLLTGVLPFSLVTEEEQSRNIIIQAELPYGTPIGEARKVRELITKTISEVRDELHAPLKAGLLAQIGAPMLPTANGDFQYGSHVAAVSFELAETEGRQSSPLEFSKKLQEKLGTPGGVYRMAYRFGQENSALNPIQVHLSHRSKDAVEAAAKELAVLLASLSHVHDVTNGIPLGKRQFVYKLTPQGRSLGLTSNYLGGQIRDAFFGAEALRQQRGRNDVKVMVRLPIEERSNLHDLENLVVRTPGNAEVFLSAAATVLEEASYPEIARVNGSRALTVNANTDLTETERANFLNYLQKEKVPLLTEKYPGLSVYLEQEQGDTLANVKLGFAFVILVIFTLLAILLRSYSQPIIIMTGLPFCIVGAVLGHLILGTVFTTMSIMGIAALSGVVLNSALIMVITADNLQEKGFSPLAAIRQAVLLRFRPIFLTTATTFLSVLPLMFDLRPQGREIAPFAISLGFGILSSTLISFAIVPAMYLIINELTQHRQTPIERMWKYFKLNRLTGHVP